MIATLQWILGPYLSYNFLHPFDYYYMPVPQAEYFALAIPGVLFFAAGLYAMQDKYESGSQILSNLRLYFEGKHSIGLYLIAAGFFFSYAGKFMPASLAFFVYLLANLKYIGAFYVLLSNRKDKYIYIGLVLFFLVVDAFAMALFHDLLLWMAFLFLLFSLSYKLSFIKKISVLGAGFLVAFTLQAVKGDYRGAVWGGQISEELTKTDVLESSLETMLAGEGLFSEKNNKNFIYRINQGWIVGHIMVNTPQNEPYAEGETIKEGIKATLLPRFLAPDKVLSGGKDLFEKYSGLELIEGTSMDLSPLGEAYANFATSGGAIFMFFLGLLYAAVLSHISKLSLTTPSLVLWIPLLFQQAIKAESDITTGINHIFKAAIVIFLVYWIAKHFFRTKL